MKRCGACQRLFLPARPGHRLCGTCWLIMRSGHSPGWAAARERELDAALLDAIARDDEYDRRRASGQRSDQVQVTDRREAR